MPKPINFEYQKVGDMTLVALDSKLADYKMQPSMIDGKMMMRIPEKTIKDCRCIDGCVYLHLGRVSDTVMINLIELFQKAKQEKGWKQGEGIVVPDNKLQI